MNIYKEILNRNLPRLFTLYNQDKMSSLYGVGDRQYSSWNTIDFANASFQGGAYALAVAIRLNLVENEDYAFQLFHAIIMALPRIQRSNGSMEEAFPNENSFCVTAAVSADCLAAIDCLSHRLSPSNIQTYLDVIRPSIRYIESSDEHHAVISNHLAAAIAASLLWKKLTQENSQKYLHWLNIIFSNQSPEGWFTEYEGPDPGYQTLCNHYLSFVLNETIHEKFRQNLCASAQFLKYFIHPDATLGGLYGSRNTEVYYPSGCVCFAPVSLVFQSIALKMETGITQANNILPDAIDSQNFIPLLNSYAAAALFVEESPKENADDFTQNNSPLPYQLSFEKDFPHAGIFIKSTTSYYAIINYKKGGTIKVFDKQTQKIDCEDGGIFLQLKNGKWFSTQQIDQSIHFENQSIHASFYAMNETPSTPFIFAAVRIMSLTFFHSRFFRELFKKIVVRRLITRKKKSQEKAIRKFEFSQSKITVFETVTSPRIVEHINHFGKVKTIHMASSGYYLKQLQNLPHQPKLVEFKSC